MPASENKNVIELSDENFEQEVLRSPVPVLVDFWAAWCGPCRMMAPVVEKLGEEFAGVAKVAKLDVDASPEIAVRYQVTSIPTLAVFHGGELVDVIVGAQPGKVLADALRRRLAAV